MVQIKPNQKKVINPNPNVKDQSQPSPQLWRRLAETTPPVIMKLTPKCIFLLIIIIFSPFA